MSGDPSAERILVIGPSWVGDMVMAQALFMRLRDLSPGCLIDVMAPAWSEPLLARMPQVNRALESPFQHGQLDLAGRYRLGRQLRGQAYDRAIVLPNSFKSALLPRFAGIGRRTGWRGEMRRPLLNDCRRLDRARYPLMLERFVALADSPGATLPDPLPRPALQVHARDVRSARHVLDLHNERPILALCPGAEFGTSKQWPPGHYAALAAEYIKAGWQVWLFGSKNDADATAQIAESLEAAQHPYCRDLAGRTSLSQAIDLLSAATAVVSNDSGLMHVAAALNRPLLALYGSTSADFTPPMADRVKLLATDIGCRPCFQRECPLGHRACLTALTPDFAAGHLRQLLDADPGEGQRLIIKPID